MTQDEIPKAAGAGKRPRLSSAERREKLMQLVQCRSKLSADEAALLREVFPDIFTTHYDLVWSRLRRRALESHEAEDVLQEVFLALHNRILEQGFPDNLPGLLSDFTKWKLLNHLRGRKREPFSLSVLSSSSMPGSAPDVDRAVDLRALAQQILPKLSPEHQEVIEKVVLHGLSYSDAAAVLGIPEGTLNSRLTAAKRELYELAAPLLPPSQRELT